MSFYSRRNNFPPRQQQRSNLDLNALESTPEIMRIEIDRIIKEFLDNPEVTEYIFSSDLNNLQRKYIHFVAQRQNIISRSYGKEPDRKLHIKKKNKHLSSQYFMIWPCERSKKYLKEFLESTPSSEGITTHNAYNVQKVPGKLINSKGAIPPVINVKPEVANTRYSLPVFEHKEEILETIKNNQIVVISSETGSGKTTQIPQYIVEESALHKQPCKIICTQPRRISTVAAAERVSYERNDTVGASVGYHIKLEQQYGFNTNIIFCTTGVFLRNLMCSSDSLQNITHIIIDEIHERDKLSDFLLICLKQSIHEYPNLKLILMSATINTNKFVEYFENVKVLTIPGRLYMIETQFLEDVLRLTKYMSPRMRAAKLKQKSKPFVVQEPSATNVVDLIKEPNICVDEALDEYLNFCENYDYTLHYEQATAQLGMYFLSEGVSVDYQHSQTGQTALMIAAFLGDKEFVSRLCTMGADLNLSCNIQKTAFDYASDHPEILRILEYVKNKRTAESQGTDKNDEGEELLELYDKTTPDDFVDYELIITLITFIHNSNTDGSILVFLSGYDEIMLCNDYILNSSLDPNTYKIFFLHSSMNIRDQNDVFKRLPDRRKIILSTNIAETSVTIDDVVFVIDLGKAKEKCFDAYNKVSSLQTQWISKACANQRKGRAGRTRPGMCFRLYSKQRFLNMVDERIPEILRVSLEELCLHAKVLAPETMNIHNFLALAPDPPSANSIKVAIENLQFLGALDKEEDLTRLGAYLSQLTIEPRLGKMLLYGVIFKCLEPVLTLVAAMSHKDPFQLPPQANLKSWAAEKRKSLVDGVLSDHILYLEVFKKWQESYLTGRVLHFCQEYYISQNTMSSILETRSQLLGQLRAIKFVHQQSSSLDEYNKNANCWPLVKSIICTGSYPNLAYPLLNDLATRTEKKINIPASSLCGNQKITTWLIYDEMMKHRNALLIKGVTAVTALTVCLVCGIEAETSSDNVMNIDDWVEFEFPDHSVLYLRNAIEFLVNKVLATPWYTFNNFDNLVLSTLKQVLEAEELIADLKCPYNVGARPRFFVPNKVRATQANNNWRNKEFNSPQRKHSSHNQYVSNLNASGSDTYKPNANSNGRGRFNPNRSEASPKRHTGAVRRIPNSAREFPNDNQNSVCQSIHGMKLSASSPAEMFFNITQEPLNWRHTGDKIADSNIFMLIKPKLVRNVEIAQKTAKWIFAPQTEKKIMAFISKKKPVFLLFSVHQTNAFQGVARFIRLFDSDKPTAVIDWIFKSDLLFTHLRHLRNPYNGNRPIYEGVDGQIIQEQVGEELLRIYHGVSKGCRLSRWQ